MQRQWPRNQEQRRKRTIEHAEYALSLLEDAREKLRKRDHPALITADIADAMRYLSDIKLMMVEAKEGVE